MAVIEKSYGSLSILGNIVYENLPDWLTAKSSTTRGVPYRLAANSAEYMDLYLRTSTTTSRLFSCYIKSAKNGVDAYNELGGSVGTSDASNANDNGVVRIIKKDKTFAITILSPTYEVRTGVIIAFTGDISDGNFYIIYSPGSHTGTSASGIYSKICTMRNTCYDVNLQYGDFTEETVLIPCCDYMHGYIEPISDVFMPIVREQTAPNVLYNGQKKYYKITPNDGDLTIPFYMEE